VETQEAMNQRKLWRWSCG